jgi:anti-sigma factor RsiW
VSCQPELVTGYVDAALDSDVQVEIEQHLATCSGCAAQAESERALRRRLLGLLHPPLPAEIEAHVQQRLRRPRRVRMWPALVPLAAMAAVLLLWARQHPQFVAWEMARDHEHCFSRDALPAKVWAEDRETVLRWFENQGTHMPVIPERSGAFRLIGARYCSLPDLTRTGHVYYRSDKHVLSLFVVPRSIGERAPERYVVRGHIVEVARLGDLTVGVVGDENSEVEAFANSFRTTRAALSPLP